MRTEDSRVELSEKRLREIFAESGHDFAAEGCMGLTFGELDGAAIEEFRKRWIAKARKAQDGRWGLALTLASLARTRPDVAFTRAPTAFAELGGAGPGTAHRRPIDRCPASGSAWQAMKRRGAGEIHRALTRPGMRPASARPSESPTRVRRPQQRGLPPLISLGR